MASLAVAWSFLTPPDAGAARCPKADRESCRSCFDSALIDGVPGKRPTKPCPDATSLVTARQTRTQEANIALEVCKGQAPQDAGTCGRIVRWLNRCLRERQTEVNESWTLFKRRARARCGTRAVAVAD